MSLVLQLEIYLEQFSMRPKVFFSIIESNIACHENNRDLYHIKRKGHELKHTYIIQ